MSLCPVHINHHNLTLNYNRMKKFTASIVLFSVAVLVIFQGCAKNPLGAVKVTGTVTLDGKPEEGVRVAFCPQSETGRECFGLTDDQGKFDLTISGTEVGSGAIPGEYSIELTKIFKEKLGPDALPPSVPPPLVHLIPEKYSSRVTTDIAPVKVEKGKKNNFTFDMKSP